MICLLRTIVNGEHSMSNHVEIFSKLLFLDCSDLAIPEFVMPKPSPPVLLVTSACHYTGNEKSPSGWCVDGHTIFSKGSSTAFPLGVSYTRIVCFSDWLSINAKKLWNRRNRYLDIFCT